MQFIIMGTCIVIFNDLDLKSKAKKYVSDALRRIRPRLQKTQKVSEYRALLEPSPKERPSAQKLLDLLTTRLEKLKLS